MTLRWIRKTHRPPAPAGVRLLLRLPFCPTAPPHNLHLCLVGLVLHRPLGTCIHLGRRRGDALLDLARGHALGRWVRSASGADASERAIKSIASWGGGEKGRFGAYFVFSSPSDKGSREGSWGGRMSAAGDEDAPSLDSRWVYWHPRLGKLDCAVKFRLLAYDS